MFLWTPELRKILQPLDVCLEDVVVLNSGGDDWILQTIGIQMSEQRGEYVPHLANRER